MHITVARILFLEDVTHLSSTIFFTSDDHTNPLKIHLKKFTFLTAVKMALSQAAFLVEKALGHGDNATIEQDVSNPARDRQKYADPSGETMKALAWMGKGDVQLS